MAVSCAGEMLGLQTKPGHRAQRRRTAMKRYLGGDVHEVYPATVIRHESASSVNVSIRPYVDVQNPAKEKAAFEGENWLAGRPGPRIVVDCCLVGETALAHQRVRKRACTIRALGRVAFRSRGRRGPCNRLSRCRLSHVRSAARRGDIPMAGFQTSTYGRFSDVHRGLRRA